MSKLTACAVFMLFSALLWAQFGASLQGTVADSSGAAVPNAKVTLTNTETSQKFTGSTSAEGFYRFTGLAPGTYSLAVEASNFTRQVISVPVQAEQSQGADVVLKPGAVTETVIVNGEAPTLVQTENAQIGEEMTTRQFESLPQFARDPYDLLRLVPNTTADMARAGNGNSVFLPNTASSAGVSAARSCATSCSGSPPMKVSGSPLRRSPMNGFPHSNFSSRSSPHAPMA